MNDTSKFDAPGLINAINLLTKKLDALDARKSRQMVNRAASATELLSNFMALSTATADLLPRVQHHLADPSTKEADRDVGPWPSATSETHLRSNI
jgi:hypothetical protein